MTKHTITSADLLDAANGDCIYNGPLEPARRFLQRYAKTTVERTEGRVSVLVCTTHTDGEAVTWENLDSWGTGPDEETAWRFALGAEFGPADSEFEPFELA